MTTTTTTEDPPKRYQRLVDTIDKSLSESLKAFDTNAAVKECYGDDASIFAEGGTENMLGEVIDGMVEGVNDRVREEIMQVLADENVREKLHVVEGIIKAFENADAEEKRKESQDRQSAKDALRTTKLPDGVSPADIVSYHSFSIMKQEREKLLADIADVEGEMQQMEEQIQKGTNVVEKRMKNIREVGNELGRSADVCSMVA